jgi:hypothetical protein
MLRHTVWSWLGAAVPVERTLALLNRREVHETTEASATPPKASAATGKRVERERMFMKAPLLDVTFMLPRQKRTGRLELLMLGVSLK